MSKTNPSRITAHAQAAVHKSQAGGRVRRTLTEHLH